MNVDDPDKRKPKQSADEEQAAVPEAEPRRFEKEKQRHDKLLEIRKDIFREPGPASQNPHSGAFLRMLFSIPIFLLFWLIYLYFSNK